MGRFRLFRWRWLWTARLRPITMISLRQFRSWGWCCTAMTRIRSAGMLRFDLRRGGIRPMRLLRRRVAIVCRAGVRGLGTSNRRPMGMLTCCGKSLSLVAIGEAVMSRFSPEEAQLTLIDPKAAPARYFLGRARMPPAAGAQEVDRFSLAAMFALAALCLIAGIFPGPFIDAIAPVATTMGL